MSYMEVIVFQGAILAPCIGLHASGERTGQHDM